MDFRDSHRVLASCVILAAVSCACGARLSLADDAGPLPGTQPLDLKGDIASELVGGVDKFFLDQTVASVEGRSKHWQRDFTSNTAYDKSLAPNRRRLAHILGVRDSRVPFEAPQLLSTVGQTALLGKCDKFEAYAIRWPAFDDVHGEGLLLVPTGREPIADIVAIPDCHQIPEDIAGLTSAIAPELQFARRLAACGCRVVVPMLINRNFKTGKLTNREWIYRSAYELGRGLIGYEVQKTLSCVDWFSKSAQDGRKIGVIGWGEGGCLALYAGAIDPRIAAVCVSGYFDSRQDLWQEPVDRNVFGLLEEFGDAELASMIAPRSLIVEAAHGPEAILDGVPGAPGRVVTPRLESVRNEFERAQQLIKNLKHDGRWELVVSGDDGNGGYATDRALSAMLNALSPEAHDVSSSGTVDSTGLLPDATVRQARQIHELDRHNQALLHESQYTRKSDFWDKLNTTSLDDYSKSVEPFRRRFSDDVIGRFELERLLPNARTRKTEENSRWTRYEVVLDVFPNVIAYGLLTMPAGIRPGEKRPVVVCQHGLEGRPQDTIGDASYETYKAFSTQIAERGFITFAPQNLYIFEDRFRKLQRKANPIKKTLFSVMRAQHEQIVDWLQSLPEVDPSQVGFYGLSYGGKTALRLPALIPDYAISICSGDFNEWIEKVASTSNPYSYASLGEYEIFEFDLGNTFGHAEMAALIAPRPFMVERGHFDGVGSDEMVGWEYAKVQHLYSAQLGIPDRSEIEWFVGPHTINGVGTFHFLEKHLGRPPTAPPASSR